MDAAKCIVKNFLPEPSPDGLDKNSKEFRIKLVKLQQSIVESILRTLRDMKETLLTSPFVRHHSFIGSSLLYVADANGPSTGVFLIDLTKTF